MRNSMAVFGVLAAAGLAVAQPAVTDLVVNGGFEADPPLSNWFVFGNAGVNTPANFGGPDPAGLLDNNWGFGFGNFSGGENFNGLAQTLTGWQFGQVIEFGGDAYTSSGDSIAGSPNQFFIALNFFDAANNFLFNVPTNLVDGSTPNDTLVELRNTFTIGQDLNGLVDRIEIVAVFRQEAGSFAGGSVFFDNIFANVPAPGAFAMLGLGGLAAARRRR